MTDVKDDMPNDVSKLKITAKHQPSTKVPIDNANDINFPPLGSVISTSSKRRRSSAAAAAINFRRPSINGSSTLGKKDKKRKKTLYASYEVSEPKQPSSGSIKFTTFQQYLLHALDIDGNAPQSTFKINHRTSLENIVVLVIPSLDMTKLGYVENNDTIVVDDMPTKSQKSINCVNEVKAIPELQFFNEHFQKSILMRAPGSKDQIFPLTKALLTRQYTKNEKKKVKDDLAKKRLILPDLIMTYDEFVANGYPIHPGIKNITGDVEPLPNGWKDTYKFEHDGSHTFAMDCEMCQGKNGKVLTRISLINFKGEKILDELVKPEEPITDYLTAYSGITEEMLSDVTTTLSEIQERVLGLISADDILIGHSLENDLKVMKIRHPKVIDTALVFEHPRGVPFKSSLKYLTKQYLNRVIQEGSHDSIVDSVSCLDLVKLKLVEGGALIGKTIEGELIFNDLHKLNKEGIVIDYHRVQPGQDRYHQVASDDEAIDKVINSLNSKRLIIAHLKDFELKKEEDRSNLYKSLNDRLTKLYSKLPSNALLHILTATGDQTHLNELMARKRTFNREYATKKFSEIESSWSSQDDDELKVCVLKTRMGLLFGKVKVKDEDQSNVVVEQEEEPGVVDQSKLLF